jgi:hypothetical protein
MVWGEIAETPLVPGEKPVVGAAVDWVLAPRLKGLAAVWLCVEDDAEDELDVVRACRPSRRVVAAPSANIMTFTPTPAAIRGPDLIADNEQQTACHARTQ